MFDFISKVQAQPIVGPTVTQLPPSTSLETIYGNIIAWALYIGGAIAVVFIIYGGFIYITSAGDQEKATQGRATLTNAIIGVIIISLAIAIVTWVNRWLQGNII